MSIAARALRALAPVLDLVLRVWVAQAFLVSGLLKAADWPRALYLAEHEYPVPWLAPGTAAAFGLAIELVGGALLALGLATRAAAFALAVLTVVVHTWYVAIDANVVTAALLACWIVSGAGALSIDRVIAPGLAASAVPLAAPVLAALEQARRRWSVAFLVLLATLALVPGLPTGLAGIAAVLALAQSFPGSLLDRLLSMKRGGPAAYASRPRVVIIGAGFGGLSCAKALADAPVDVTLVDRRNHHLFQPLLYQVATTALAPGDIATPIRGLFRDHENVRVQLGEVTGVDTAAGEVLIGDARLPYDHLVIATGASHSYFGRDDWAVHAPGLKRIEDALEMRRRLLVAFEQAEATDDVEARRQLLTFVVVGGGPTGVELAGAIAELARTGMDKDFRRFDPATARVVLLEAGPRLLAAFPEGLSAATRRSLERLGVEVRVASRVERIDARGALVGGELIASSTVLWAAGVVASPASRWLGAAADRAGRVVVGPDLAVPGLANIHAVGDTAFSQAWDGKPVPGLAPAAKQGGRYVAACIRAKVLGRGAPPPFRYRHLGSLATIGRQAAVVDLGRVRLSGAVAWWLWGAVHVGLLTGTRNRLSVVVDWVWSYLTLRSGTRLITGDDAGSDTAARRMAA